MTAPFPDDTQSLPSPPGIEGDTRPTWWQSVSRDARYLLVDWPLLLVAFVLVIPLFFSGVGLVVVWVGLPILVGTALLARGFATLERSLLTGLQGRPAPAAYQPVRGGNRFSRMLSPLRDPQTWLDGLWVVLNFIVSTITWPLTVIWVVSAACVVLGPVIAIWFPILFGDENYGGLAELLRLPYPATAEVVLYFVYGLLFAATLRPALRGVASLQGGLAHWLLCSRAESAARITELRDSRDAGRRAESDALRKLERDIHDGPQQRLIRLNMDLARASRSADTDPEKTRTVLAGAMQQTQDTLAELRQLSRGIAPPVLVDRGLAAAIAEAAARSEVPVTIQADLDRPLPDHVATAAYFVVSEALANLNKHSAATAAEVDAGVEADRLVVAVTDNGVGGAGIAKGHGLAGLEQRLQAVDGRLEVVSPVGGPTVVRASIPLGS